MGSISYTGNSKTENREHQIKAQAGRRRHQHLRHHDINHQIHEETSVHIWTSSKAQKLITTAMTTNTQLPSTKHNFATIFIFIQVCILFVYTTVCSTMNYAGSLSAEKFNQARYYEPEIVKGPCSSLRCLQFEHNR